MGVSTFATATLLSCFLLLHVSAERTREPFNGAVHTDPGHDAADDGMTEVPFSDADWKDLGLSAKFVTRKSWQVGAALVARARAAALIVLTGFTAHLLLLNSSCSSLLFYHTTKKITISPFPSPQNSKNNQSQHPTNQVLSVRVYTYARVFVPCPAGAAVPRGGPLRAAARVAEHHRAGGGGRGGVPLARGREGGGG